jgi:hypothetical protein
LPDSDNAQDIILNLDCNAEEQTGVGSELIIQVDFLNPVQYSNLKYCKVVSFN